MAIPERDQRPLYTRLVCSEIHCRVLRHGLTDWQSAMTLSVQDFRNRQRDEADRRSFSKWHGDCRRDFCADMPLRVIYAGTLNGPVNNKNEEGNASAQGTPMSRRSLGFENQNEPSHTSPD